MSGHDTRDHAGAALIGAWLLGWPSGALRAAVVMKGWEWFVTDTFGTPSLGLIEAWGLVLLVSLATMSHPGEDSRPPLRLMVHGFLLSVVLSGVVFLSLLILAALR